MGGTGPEKGYWKVNHDEKWRQEGNTKIGRTTSNNT
jgi:hypothetical protein